MEKFKSVSLVATFAGAMLFSMHTSPANAPAAPVTSSPAVVTVSGSAGVTLS